MSNMKYLMLFEAFQSNTLSKMMKFLDKKVDKDSKQRFRERLVKLIQNLDIPIDKISDIDVKYLNRNQSLKLRNVDDINNIKGIYCLKFWFSIDEGYLGFTGVGNNSMNFKEYLSGSRRRRNENQNSPFTYEELDYIKNELGITTGKLTPLKNYEDLTHKQLVIGLFSGDPDDTNRIGLAKIWRNENGGLYGIQNVAEGGYPEGTVDGEHWRDWRNEDGTEFNLSWDMASVNSPADDHYKIHIYTPSEEPLHIEGVKKEEKKEEPSSPFDFNLPLSSSYRISEWGDTSWSIDDYTLVEKSDFSIVLMIDDILKSVEKPVSSVKKEREESKEGATKLMSDSQIKKANIERYLTAMVGKMGIETDIKELKNLQKLVIKSICSDFAFISIYKSRPGFDNLDNITSFIYDMMRSSNETDKGYYLKNITSNYKSLNSHYEDYVKVYNESLKSINETDIEPIKEVFEILMGIGKKITTYLQAQNIQTIEDLSMVLAKLKSIRTLANERGLSLGYTRYILNEFHYPGDVRYYLREYNDRRKDDVLEDVRKAKNIERYVDSLLR